MPAAGIITAPGAARPLHLEVNEVDNQLVIRLVGASQAAVSARYELEVAGGPAGSSNHSIQRGTASLQPGKLVTLATLRVGNPGGASWTVRLHVTPSSGEPYRLAGGHPEPTLVEHQLHPQKTHIFSRLALLADAEHSVELILINQIVRLTGK